VLSEDSLATLSVRPGDKKFSGGWGQTDLGEDVPPPVFSSEGWTGMVRLFVYLFGVRYVFCGFQEFILAASLVSELCFGRGREHLSNIHYDVVARHQGLVISSLH
jgi:hypothetical protein